MDRREFLVRTALTPAALSLAAQAAAQAPALPDGPWIKLFNGKNLEGWTPKIKGFELGDNYGDTFRVEDGVIKVRYDNYTGPFRGRFGHLFYKDEFSNYVLRLEYRFVGEQAERGPGWAIRNSGVMIHGQRPETMRKDQDFPVSLEVQLLGGDGKGPRTTGNLCTPGTNVVYQGKLHTDHCTSSTSETFAGDQWVKCEVEVMAAASSATKSTARKSSPTANRSSTSATPTLSGCSLTAPQRCSPAARSHCSLRAIPSTSATSSSWCSTARS